MTIPMDGFTEQRIDVGDVRIAAEVGGAGPPLLLLHGYPQHRAMWRHVAPGLTERFTVVATDLRGYGESSKPPGDPAHAGYAKRTMAADQVGVMKQLGFDRFAVCGHDRGGRVAHRMCLDHPQAVAAAAVVDIVPTLHLFETAGRAFASAYYHWFFLSQPADLPERLIGAAPSEFLTMTLDRWSAPGFTFPPEILTSYVAAFDADAIHASCEDYRAAATIDLEHDAADRDRRIECPLLVLWGELGAMHRLYDVPATWRDRAREVTAHSLPCGHFVPEEAPLETEVLLSEFLFGVPEWAAG
jgi:haloacetate dehalogenase